ncbi:copper resistance D family protein, partial [Azospirillum isscasi]
MAGGVLLAAGAVGASLALAATGHAATAEPRWLSVPLVALHGLAVGFWIGSFWPLAVLLRTEPPHESLRLVRRFSGWAVPAVAVLLLAGAGLSALQLADPRAILTTAYGQIWAAKIACALVLLGLAALNRWRLTPRLETMGRDAATRLRASVHTEMVVAALVVLFTAGLGTTPPPRTQAPPVVAERPAGFSTAVMAQGRMAILTVTPALPGTNRIELRLAGPDGAPLDALEVSVELALPAAGIEAIARPLPKQAPGVYAADGVALPVAGSWSVRVNALVSDFEKVPFRAAVPVGR